MPDIDSFSGTGSDELESTVPDIFVVSPEASQADTGSNIGQESTAGTFNKSYGGTDSTMSLQVPDSRATRNRGRRRRLSAGTETTTANLSLKFGRKVLNVDVEVPSEFTKEQTDRTCEVVRRLSSRLWYHKHHKCRDHILKRDARGAN
jgi:hypothetical protein